jgi:hypothetical protein
MSASKNDADQTANEVCSGDSRDEWDSDILI